jgi:hypothetical protein
MAGTGTTASPLVEVAGLIARQGGLMASALTEREVPAAPLGDLVLAGRLGSEQPVRAVVLEAVREGYLCHYGVTRLIEPEDADLALLAGDLLFALGLRELASLGDSEPVELLADLITGSAEMEASGAGPDTGPLWLARAVELGTGLDLAEPALFPAVVSGESGAGDRLTGLAGEAAREAGIGSAFDEAREAIQ